MSQVTTNINFSKDFIAFIIYTKKIMFSIHVIIIIKIIEILHH